MHTDNRHLRGEFKMALPIVLSIVPFVVFAVSLVVGTPVGCLVGMVGSWASVLVSIAWITIPKLGTSCPRKLNERPNNLKSTSWT